MGLFKTAAKVAVASSVHGRVQRRQQSRWAEQDQAAAQAASGSGAPAVTAPAPAAPTLAAPTPAAAPVSTHADADPMARQLALLRQLGDLRSAGILSEAEFEAKKALILAS